MADQCGIELVTDSAVWESLFARVECPHITQSWAYGEAKQAAVGWRTRRVIFDVGGWRARRLVIIQGGEPVAICQILEKSLGGIATASRLNRGPLFLDSVPESRVIRDVYGALRRYARRRRGPLVVAPALLDAAENACMLSELGYRPRRAAGWCSDRVDLRPDEQVIYANLRGDWRRRLKLAEREGVEYKVCEAPEDLEWMIDRHVENMAQKGFVGADPAFIRALSDAAPPGAFLVLQVQHEGEAVGGTIVYRFGNVAEGLVLWLGEHGRRVNAGRYLDWQASLDLKRRGSWCYDLGGKRAGATETFKSGMGGVEYRLLNEWVAF